MLQSPRIVLLLTISRHRTCTQVYDTIRNSYFNHFKPHAEPLHNNNIIVLGRSWFEKPHSARLLAQTWDLGQNDTPYI